MGHRVETVLSLRDGDMLAVLSTGYGKKFNRYIDAIIEVEECTTINNFNSTK